MKTTIMTSLLIAAATAFATAQERENWIGVAHFLGGNGMAPGGLYTRFVPSKAWGPSTPPIWIRFKTERDGRTVRLSIPVLREKSAVDRLTLQMHLGPDAKVIIRESWGRTSPHVALWAVAQGRPAALARDIRIALEAIEPGALARVEGRGVVKRAKFECEPYWAIVTSHGEKLETPKLPKEFQKVGLAVRFTAERCGGGRDSTFSYFGGTGDFGATNYWTSHATTLLAIELDATAAKRASRSGKVGGQARLDHARVIIAKNTHRDVRLARPLATGFNSFENPGFAVCPDCTRELGKDWLFTDSGHDKVEATLHVCDHDGHYYLSRDGHDYGPFVPSSTKKEKR